MKARIGMLLVALVLLVAGSLEPTTRSFIPAGGHFRGHGASSSW